MSKQNKLKRFYAENGFCIFNWPIVDNAQVRNALTGMDNVRAGKYDQGKPPEESPWNPGDDIDLLCKIEQPQVADSAIAELIGSPEVGELVAEATGAQMVQVWWAQLLYKPPVSGSKPSTTKVGWHRDWTYWKNFWEDGSELLTAWVALSDVDESSGAMKFADKSHRWEDIDGGDFFSQQNGPQDFNPPPGAQWKETLALLPAGGFSIHHKLTLHGSDLNVSLAPRRSFAIHLRTEKSAPRAGRRAELTKYIDDLEVCPIIYGKRLDRAFL